RSLPSTFVNSLLFTQPYVPPRHLHSFPTRRSSDLPQPGYCGCHSQTLGRALPFGPKAKTADAAKSVSCRRDECLCLLAAERERRSEEHTSELQSRGHLVCRLLLEKKKQKQRSLINR